MTAKVDSRKDIKDKVMRGMRGEYNDLVEDFMNKVNRGDIKNGSVSLSLEEAKNWCSNRNLDTNNEFRCFMMYWTNWRNEAKRAKGPVIGMWFNEDSGFGDILNQAIVKYTDNYIKKGNK